MRIPAPAPRQSYVQRSHVPYAYYTHRKHTAIYGNRMYTRHPMDLRARLLSGKDTRGQFSVVHGRTVDLSRGGAGLTLSREVAPGTEVVLSVQPPGSRHPLILPAVIVRSQGFRVGVKFLDTTAQQRLQLCELCEA
jgi:hypothetical protein